MKVQTKVHKEANKGDNLREKLIMKKRKQFLSGEGKSYSWDEVKDMTLTEKERQILSDLEDAIIQVNLHKEGKIKLNTLQEVLDKF